ncbi:phosphoglycerate mutase family protein [Piedraia hortae CBS 480.64]|uniref:Phosphoglycerate mutase family protein n=1 Tax=Piedraia hortae CBS 480.64 TaxID=1314780 RepID=A0A6A7C1C7_9PEZI|nr:phosphoglycerate mutase family protein [Piedraia hortae CBS 480.64]
MFAYEAVKGFFWQDEPGTDPATFDHISSNFGLIERSYPETRHSDTRVTQWQRFYDYLEHLIASSPSNVTYKLIYMGRHGEGEHNVAEALYGTNAWDDYWSKLDGDGTLFWSDAHLTSVGQAQAREARAFMQKQIQTQKMPAPQSYYVSPLYRCLQTANLTFGGLELPADGQFRPVIKEMLREVLGVHTCDRRSSRTAILHDFPNWTFELGFQENDRLWRANHRETWDEHDARERALLSDIFTNDPNPVISFTAHSGTIASLLRVTKHRVFALPTGALIPVLVKAIKIVT